MIVKKLRSGLNLVDSICSKALIPYYVVRPMNMARRWPELRARRACAARVKMVDCYEVEKLREDGYLRIAPPSGDLDQLVAAGRQKLESHLEAFGDLQVSVKGWVQLLTEEDCQLGSTFLRFALDETALNTVARYFGFAPRLEQIKLFYTVPADREPQYTQLWHRDYGDSTQVKVFVYITDVSSENGPFTCLPRQVSQRMPFYAKYVGHTSDGFIERYLPTSEAVQFMGKAGSSLMVDTTKCLHFGGRCIRPRLMFMVTYSSGFYRPFAGRPCPPKSSGKMFSEMQRHALGL